jgi:hypothetical protein
LIHKVLLINLGVLVDVGEMNRETLVEGVKKGLEQAKRQGKA